METKSEIVEATSCKEKKTIEKKTKPKEKVKNTTERMKALVFTSV